MIQRINSALLPGILISVLCWIDSVLAHPHHVHAVSTAQSFSLLHYILEPEHLLAVLVFIVVLAAASFFSRNKVSGR